MNAVRFLKLASMAVVAGWSSPAFCQGTVSFYSDHMFIATNSVRGGPSTGLTWDRSVAPDAFYYALFSAPTNQTSVDNSLAGWEFTGNYATNSVAGGLYGNPGTDAAVIPGYGAGIQVNLVIVGWSANVGHDWSTVGPMVQDGSIVNAGFFAVSGIATDFTLAGGGTAPGVIMGANFPYQIAGFTLNAPVPEPAGPTLLVLGGLAAWSLRRGCARR